jgi:IS605 OrfB family transposase
MAIRTRLRLSDRDEIVLRALAAHLGSLAGKDLQQALNTPVDLSSLEAWAKRKQTITADSSSRWAGTITRETNDLIGLARMGQARHLTGIRTSIKAIETRLDIPIGGKVKIKGKTVSGYHDGDEVFAKTQRLQGLKVRLAQVEFDATAGRLHVVRGGKKLLRTRHNLAAAGLTTERWAEYWWSARHHIAANGSHDELGGNLTIRVDKEGLCSILLPTSLRHLANDKSKTRYVLDARVAFSYRIPEWQAQLASGRAISYDIRHDAIGDRWYLSASWFIEAKVDPIPITRLSVAVDFNADHLACWVIDDSGNPVGSPISIPFAQEGSVGQRDGHLRWAISQLIAFANAAGASRIYIEDLGFVSGKSRESGQGKVFRNLVSGFPTSKFKARLQAMAARSGIELVAVDPAYTSAWSKRWINPTSTTGMATTSHMAAAIGIGRRGLSLSISRREGVTGHNQRIVRGELLIRRASNEKTIRSRARAKATGSRQLQAVPYPSPLSS